MERVNFVFPFANTAISGNLIVSLLFYSTKEEILVLNLHCLSSGRANRCILKSGQIGTLCIAFLIYRHSSSEVG